MNEKNFEYLKDNLKYMGFGDQLNDQLANNLKMGYNEFSLHAKTVINNKSFEAFLNFRKSDNSDMYFFNSYKASLTRSNGDTVDQTFYLYKGKGVTAKESYNLLEGRSIFKELNTKSGQAYNAWLQLDFGNRDKNNNYEVKQFHENYGFDLQGTLAKYPIAEIADSEKMKPLIHSLQKGNLQAVTFEKSGESVRMFIEANPQYKTLNVFDEHLKKVQREELEQKFGIQKKQEAGVKETVNEEQKEDKKKSVKQDIAQAAEGIKKKTSRKKGLST